ncbi:MAG TPA: sulfate ABC transporter permease subunit [Anaerolineales bacterium]|jgi:sulfate/thiosulfate transport system permease protein|nr:sulfate ABC transporter permease subunit [Anaerolineales bacterium]
MSVTISSHTTQTKEQSSLLTWMDKNKGKWTSWILIAIVVFYVAFLILTPITALAFGAFEKGIGEIISSLNQPDVFLAFWNTLWISLVVVTIHAIFGTLVAWVFVRHRFPGRNLINGLVDMPFAVSPVVAGYMLLLLFGRNGILAPVIEQLGIQVAFAMPGMLLATMFVTLPFMIRELIPVLEAFDTRQEKAAATLGANGWQTFWRVTFPALRWGMIYGITLTFARALGEFGAVLVIGGGVQGRTETATLFIYRALEERQYIGAYSAALVLGLFSLILVLGSDWLRRRKH